MNYTLVKAVLREKTPNSKYQEVNIASLTLDQIFSNYLDGWIELNHSHVTTPYWVPLTQLRQAEIPFGLFNFTTWLGQVAEISLPSYETEPTLVDSQVYYLDGIKTGLHAIRVTPTLETGEEYPESSLSDVRLNLDGVDVNALNDYLLLTFNGLCHYSYATRGGLIARHAGKTIDISNRGLYGAINFERIGKLTKIPLKENMISGASLRSEVYINLNTDLTDKSLILSIGGYLHIADGSYFILDVTRGIIKISTFSIDLVKRMMSSIDVIDLSPLGLTDIPHSQSSISIAEALSNSVLKKYFSLDQSFAIVVDAPHLYSERVPIARTPIPGLYEYHKQPQFPFIDTYGAMPEYWASPALDGAWNINIRPDLHGKNELYNTGEVDGDSVIYDAQTDIGYFRHHGQLLEIGSQIIEAD